MGGIVGAAGSLKISWRNSECVGFVAVKNENVKFILLVFQQCFSSYKSDSITEVLR